MLLNAYWVMIQPTFLFKKFNPDTNFIPSISLLVQLTPSSCETNNLFPGIIMYPLLLSPKEICAGPPNSHSACFIQLNPPLDECISSLDPVTAQPFNSSLK